MIDVEIKCRDYGQAGCLETPDENYTMRLGDTEEECVHWCSHCGPEALQFMELLIQAISIKGVEFVDNLIERYERNDTLNKS